MWIEHFGKTPSNILIFFVIYSLSRMLNWICWFCRNDIAWITCPTAKVSLKMCSLKSKDPRITDLISLYLDILTRYPASLEETTLHRSHWLTAFTVKKFFPMPNLYPHPWHFFPYPHCLYINNSPVQCILLLFRLYISLALIDPLLVVSHVLNSLSSFYISFLSSLHSSCSFLFFFCTFYFLFFLFPSFFLFFLLDFTIAVSIWLKKEKAQNFFDTLCLAEIPISWTIWGLQKFRSILAASWESRGGWRLRLEEPRGREMELVGAGLVQEEETSSQGERNRYCSKKLFFPVSGNLNFLDFSLENVSKNEEYTTSLKGGWWLRHLHPSIPLPPSPWFPVKISGHLLKPFSWVATNPSTAADYITLTC